MSDRSSLLHELHELDECLARSPLPAGLEARIEAKIETFGATRASPDRRSTTRRFAVPALAFAAGVVLMWAWSGRHSVEPVESRDVAVATHAAPASATLPWSPTPGWANLAVEDGDCRWSQDGSAITLATSCRARLDQPAMTIEVWRGARLEPYDDGVRVHEGLLAFSVDRVAPSGRPARVAVSGGIIEVLGTRFVVDQTKRRGHVDLIEGAIQFHGAGDHIEAIDPGHRFSWATPVSRTVADAKPTSSAGGGDRGSNRTGSSTPEPVDLSGVLAEVARLRRRGEDTAAIAKLDELDQRALDRRAREVISFERATLVERSASTEAACDAWTAHQTRFASGRYQADVERRLLQLRCSGR